MDPVASRVLIVDDQPANVALVSAILRESGFRNLLGCHQPARALPLAAAFEPDIVLLDLHMPGIDGFRLIRDMRGWAAERGFVPVVVLTADTSVEARQRALASGAHDFLAKPLDAVEVVLRIRSLLETRALHAQLREEKRRLEERVRERTRQLEEAQGEVLERLAQAAELHDDETGSHTRRVGESSAALAAALGLAAAEVDCIRRTAPLHDLGKIAVPDSLLRKPGPLAPEERALMQEHTVFGARILAGGRSASMRMAEQIARSHHERWDGAGYPQGLRGEAIPLPARIVAVADVFDALVHDRPYRRAWSPERALAELREHAGSHFDPAVVDAFASSLVGGLSPAHPPPG